MSQNNELHLVGTAEYSEAKRIQAALKDKGVLITVTGNPETCTTRNCKPALEMLAREQDIPAVIEFLKQERARDLGDLEISPDLLNEVYDPEKASARCPACGETFSTQAQECPGCGLGFGLPSGSVPDPEE